MQAIQQALSVKRCSGESISPNGGVKPPLHQARAIEDFEFSQGSAN
jgi:hypothetical protein